MGEHDPGVEEQIPGLCPGIPGYCTTGFINTRCRFDCVRGADVDSICTQDGTWAPYLTCSGDLRETKDGCDGCPGSSGGFRNRTAEAIISSNTVSDRRVPKIIRNDGGRKNIPSFAGNINIGRLNAEDKPSSQNRFNQQRPTQRVTSPPTQPRRNNQNFQTNFNQRKPQRQFPQRTQQQQPRQQQSFNQGLNTFNPDTESSQPLSIFEQVKNRINKGKAQEAKPTRQPTTRTTEQPSLSPSQQRIRDRILKQRQQQAKDIANILSQESVEATSEQSLFRQSPLQQILPKPSSANSEASFGVFEEVNLAGRFGGPNPPPLRQAPRQLPRQQQQQDGFFGVFPEVNLQ